ncbi:hypothetical protein SRABI121_02633 [Microbacterium sp. Bi121]|nr:hypothetical protein SRABI121_02633 [Microbacterium sp. Bi121]
MTNHETIPASICALCGRRVKADEGSQGYIEMNPTSLQQLDGRTATRFNAVPPYHAWTRLCNTCERPDYVGIIRTVLGPDTDVTEAEAKRAIVVAALPYAERVLEPASADEIKRATGKPWKHVRDEDRDVLRDVLSDVQKQTRPTMSERGGCGMCAVSVSVGWTDAPSSLRWPDGSPTAMCSRCAATWRRRGEPPKIDRLRTLGVECSTGYSSLGYEAPADFRLYAETKNPDHAGSAEPWAYALGLVAFIEETWTDDPRLAPEHRRAEFEQRRDAILAEWRAQRRAEAVSAW